ncbi:MOSC domain-containing protein [Devosia pacifica]|uniref:MOSC domain-containing protein n=1 Tax=Devosia pacifica TaxID=1335967 RepID=A0A918SEH5_9HYPH|nr:MOSC N-terminal beta barrel domain-containing protein [Devosia pacifica]GHA34923.1 MOSC domain-containing protein [Devosia pacifica]
MSRFSIEQIFIYPVKSLGGMAVSRAEITSSGSLRGDREWIVTRPNGTMLWQGDIPHMTLLSAQLENGRLIIVDRDGEFSPRAEEGGGVTVDLEGHELAGTDQGDAVADWLSHRLQSACRLVHIGRQAHQWAGLNPVHAISTVSLHALNKRLTERGEAAVELKRFRPNVVLSGTHPAFAEETVEEIIFNGASLSLREPCVRCELPNISLEDASRGKQPLKLIGALSRERPSARPASFGTYCTAYGQTLQVGMSSSEV